MDVLLSIFCFFNGTTHIFIEMQGGKYVSKDNNHFLTSMVLLNKG